VGAVLAHVPFPSGKVEKNSDEERELMPITDWALGYIVSKYAALARVEGVSPLDLRHRFGYVMSERVPLHRLAEIGVVGPPSAPGHLLPPFHTSQERLEPILINSSGCRQFFVV
jgi:hypothetical protein